MRTTKFKIENRRIEKIMEEVSIVGDNNVDTFSFEFDAEWDGRIKTAIFSKDGKYYYANLDGNDECILPSVLYGSTEFEFGLTGRTENSRLSTPSYWINTNISIYLSSGDIENLPDKDVWDIYTEEMLALVTQGQMNAENAQTSANDANDSKEDAQASATSAQTSATNAQTSASLASTSATSAQQSASSASESASSANTSKESAEASKTAAKTSEDNAKASENSAQAYKESAQSSATSAQASAQSASASASSASTSANSANESATLAVTTVNNALASISAAESTALSNINTAETTAVGNIEEAEDEAIQNIESKASSYEKRIQVLEDNFDTVSSPNSNNFVLEDSASGFNRGNIKVGDIEIEQDTTEGKNLLDIVDANMMNVGLDSANGILAQSELFTRFGSMNYIPLRAGTYSLSYKDLNSSWIWAYDANKNYLGKDYISSSWVNSYSQSFTLENDGYVRIILKYTNNANINITKDYEIQIEPGSTATSYEPYTGGQSSPNTDYPQDIKVVDGECNNKVSNKNLVDVEFEMGGYSGAGNKYSSTTRIRSKEDINLDAGTYTISSNEAISIAVYNVNDSQEVYLSSNSLTFTLTQNSNIRITIETPLLLDSKVQLEQGSTATSYAPHKEQNYSITLPEGMFLGSLETASNYIYGTKDNWKLVNGLAKTTDTSGSTSITISDMKSNGGFKSYYGGTLSGTTITYDSAIGGTNTIYYEKASSTETDITDATLISQLNNIADNLQTYKDSTIVITSGENLAPNIQFYYAQNPWTDTNSRLAAVEQALVALNSNN